MKNIVAISIAVAVVAGLSGCCGTGAMPGSCFDNPANCASCGSCGTGMCPTGPCATGACGGCDPIAARGGYGAFAAASSGMGVGYGMGAGYGGCPTGFDPACAGMACGSACEQGFMPGPVGDGGGAIAYPYYTNRGPRDFLALDPRTIGP